MQETVFLGRNNTSLKFGIQLAISLLLAIFIGLKIDEVLRSTPLFTLLLVVYAICGNFWILIRNVKK